MAFANRNLNPTQGRRELRRLIAADEVLPLPGAYDCLTARLLANMGFKALWGGSIAGSAVNLGVPDLEIMSMPEVLRWNQSLADASGLPVVCDCDTGYGGPLNVARMVQAFDRAGVGAVMIEDQASPKHCQRYYDRPYELVPTEDMAAKVRAAANARIDEELMLWARCDALNTADVDEALERMTAYAEAGADGILVIGKEFADMRAVGMAWDRDEPLFIAPVQNPEVTNRQLAEIGYALRIVPHEPMLAALQAIENVMSEYLEREALDNLQTPMKEFTDLMELVQYEDAVQLEAAATLA
jgi:2-methylisocitrate lyase-like PEP mutase family enzyme